MNRHQRRKAAATAQRQSAEWQKLAEIPKTEFEVMFRAAGKRTTAGMNSAWHGARACRLASLERKAADLRAAGWTILPPEIDP